MNTELFEGWLQVFAGVVPDSVQRPLVLILDGCALHYSAKVVDAAAHSSILLVFLPPNGTHLPETLDFAVFSTPKNKIRNLIGELVVEEDRAYYSISREDAIAVADMAWRGAKISCNIERGFKTCGHCGWSRWALDSMRSPPTELLVTSSSLRGYRCERLSTMKS
ncbi:hypothetical protein PF003_g30219 [Phytophthora fragariae]|nr:hypothetical protein PF003_g30219 [Phytophthora fragariae]